jgi:prepilin peptidase CpaA
MPFPEFGSWAVLIALTAVLGWASISDIRTRRIPNWTVLATLGLFLPWAFLHWGAWVGWALAAGAIALTIGVALYAMGVTGAGDAKLFAAVALFAGLGHLLALGVATALAGGLIAALSLASRPRRALTMFTLRGKGDFGRGIPYGVAIAVGGMLVVWNAMLALPVSGSGST